MQDLIFKIKRFTCKVINLDASIKAFLCEFLKQKRWGEMVREMNERTLQTERGWIGKKKQKQRYFT